MLERHAPEVCKQLDDQMVEYGQTWVVERIVPYMDDDLLSADLAAEYCGVTLKTIYMWRSQRGLPSIKTPDGIRFRFMDLRKWKAEH